MPATLDELRAFAAVYETAGFTAAARRLGLTTNAVSIRIRSLEVAAGVRLFVRTTRHVSPTAEARAYYAGVVRALHELDRAEEALRPPASGLRGTVRIALHGALATEPFHARVGALLDGNPDLAVQTVVSNTLANLAADGLDIAVVVGAPPASTFVGRLLGRANWVLAAAPSYLDRRGRPRVPADLHAHRCLRLLASPPQDVWTLVDEQGHEETVPVAGAYEADDSRALGDATYAGVGIGIRPAGECSRAAREGRLERVLPQHRFQPLDVYALVPPGRVRLARVAACLDALRGAVAELA